MTLQENMTREVDIPRHKRYILTHVSIKRNPDSAVCSSRTETWLKRRLLAVSGSRVAVPAEPQLADDSLSPRFPEGY